MSNRISELIELFEKTGQVIHKKVCPIDGQIEQINLGQLKVLELVSMADRGRVAMSDIAQFLQITPASATVAVDKMVKSGWLKRVDDENDRRKVFIELASEKKEHWQKMKEEQNKRLADFLNVLSDDQQQELISIMKTLISNQ